MRDKLPPELHHYPLGLRGPQSEVDGALNPVESSHHPAGQILGRAPQAAHRHPIVKGASRVEVMLGLPQTTVLWSLQDRWDGGIHRKNHRRLHGIARRSHRMHLVPLHIVLVDHLVRRHAQSKHEGRDAVVREVTRQVLACECNASVFSIENDAPDLDGPALEFLPDCRQGVIVGRLERLENFQGDRPGGGGRPAPGERGHMSAQVQTKLRRCIHRVL